MCNIYNFIPNNLNNYIATASMKKRSQIRKYTVEQINEFKSSETNADTLKLYTEHIAEKNRRLLAKQTELNEQLDAIRRQSEKLVYQMVDGIKDRLQKREQKVLDSGSRPSLEDVQSVTDLFSYMENQTNVMRRNSGSIGELAASVAQIHRQISSPDCDDGALDEVFRGLRSYGSYIEKQCAQQEVKRDKLLRERDDNRQFYTTIKDTIEEYRVRWQRVQTQISQREMQLDHLVSYFNVRQREDKAKIANQQKLSNSLEGGILHAQEILNCSSQKNRDLEARRADVINRKLL